MFSHLRDSVLNKFGLTEKGCSLFVNPTSRSLVSYINDVEHVKDVSETLVAKQLFLRELWIQWQDDVANQQRRIHALNDDNNGIIDGQYQKAYREDALEFLLQYFSDTNANAIIDRIIITHGLHYTLISALQEFLKFNEQL